MYYIIDCFTKKYTNFKDRAGRKEYICFITLFYAFMFAAVFFEKSLEKNSILYISIGLCGLLFIIPWISVHVRRLHDLNRSGWWFFLGTIIPFGIIILLVILLFLKGTTGPNKYGEEPA